MADMVSVERRGVVTIVRIDRPPANAIDLGMCARMTAAYEEALATEPGALVVTGAGRCFCSGLDLKIVPTYDTEQQHAMLDAVNDMVRKLYTCPVPVVGAINGHAIAGGFILALTPDYRVGPAGGGAPSPGAPGGGALFGLTEGRAGIPFPAAPMIVLGAELAPQHVRAITLRARTFGAEEARAMGVLDELCPPEQVLARALAVAEDLATIPPDAYARIKRQVREAAIVRLEALQSGGQDPMRAGWLARDVASAAAGVLRGGGRPEPGREKERDG
jgi:enoyl-CoA hydratase